MLRNRALIVSALPVEAKAILSFFDDVHVQSAPSGVSYLTGNRKIFSDKLGEKIRENWTFYIATPTGAGNLEVTRALHQMIPECNPDIVALIGCAGGFPGKVEQYDVVVAPRVDYIARAKVSQRTELRPQQEICSSVFVDHCKNVQLLDLWHQYLHPDITNAPINVCFEPIVSGETVLVNSRSAYFRLVQAASPKAVAIEMEGYGFLSACREYKVEAAVIQGISDTLDDKNRPAVNGRSANLGLDQAQFKATRHAAALFFATLDFVDPKAFSRTIAAQPKNEITEISMIIDAEMHDIADIQAELFELFKKHGIRNFSFKPANSVRVGFEAQLSAMRIYEALIAAGLIDRFAGFKVQHFEVRADQPDDRQLADILSRIRKLRGISLEDVLHRIRIEGWLEDFPDHTPVIVDAISYQQRREKTGRGRTGRILYPVEQNRSEEAQVDRYFGPSGVPAIILTDTKALREGLTRWQPPAANGELLRWFMGSALLDREIGLDTLLAHSKQKFFYSWPNLGALHSASNLSEKDFIDGCAAEWQIMRSNAGPSILQLLDFARSDRLGLGQIRDAILGRPATLAKSIDILTLTCRILSQNNLPIRGCIIPSLYVLAFNGVVAGDGTIERMLLTGMAGDLHQVASEAELPILAVQGALRGDTLPYLAAAALTSALDRVVLNKTKLVVSIWALDLDDASRRRREATNLDKISNNLYVKP